MNPCKLNTIILLAATLLVAAQISTALPPPEVWEERDALLKQFIDEQRNASPEVLEVHVCSINEELLKGKTWYIATVKVLNVIRSQEDIQFNDFITIKYYDITKRARARNEEIEKNLIVGEFFQPTLYLLQVGDTVNLYLRELPNEPKLFSLGAGLGSFTTKDLVSELGQRNCIDDSDG